VVEFNDDLQKLVQDMQDTIASVKWGRCMGLAAPQIGRNLRVMIVLGEVMVNPILLRLGNKITVQQEGCYSLKEGKFDYYVPRSSMIKISWQDVNGAAQIRKFHRAEAHVVQHELDHLDGHLIGTAKQLAESAKVKEVA